MKIFPATDINFLNFFFNVKFSPNFIQFWVKLLTKMAAGQTFDLEIAAGEIMGKFRRKKWGSSRPSLPEWPEPRRRDQSGAVATSCLFGLFSLPFALFFSPRFKLVEEKHFLFFFSGIR